MEFKEIVMKRYAAKSFDGKRIPEAKIHELLEMVRYAPSSLNLQPWKIMVVTDQKMKEELQKASYNQAQVGTSSHLLVFCANTDLEGLTANLQKGLSKTEIGTEQLSGFIGMIQGFVKSMKKEDRLPWAQRQLYIALGNALNGAKSLGFDSCPMEGFDPAAFSRLLKLPANIVPTALVPVGYASDKPRPKFRFSKGEVFF